MLTTLTTGKPPNHQKYLKCTDGQIGHTAVKTDVLSSWQYIIPGSSCNG